jgi:hypothetical protein
MKETGMEAASSGSSSTVKMDLGDSGCDCTLLPGACRGFGGLRGNAAGEASGARSFEARNPTGEMEIASVVLRSMMADSGVADAKGRHQGRGGVAVRFGQPIADLTRCPMNWFHTVHKIFFSILLLIVIGYDKKAAHTLDLKSPAHTCSPLYSRFTRTSLAADVDARGHADRRVRTRLFSPQTPMSGVEWSGRAKYASKSDSVREDVQRGRSVLHGARGRSTVTVF